MLSTSRLIKNRKKMLTKNEVRKLQGYTTQIYIRIRELQHIPYDKRMRKLELFSSGKTL